ncbi:MAG: hypothetical protein AB7V13_13860 [Pseudorhodoplanes sp.]|uniref:hypothetical protein n=1 Tax=Pseudorhodoplanes sp. TaxID=1934341 RepID=UPI003D14E9D9
MALPSSTAIEGSVSMLSPEEDEAILRAAGFSDISLFYAAFIWRGWTRRNEGFEVS